MKVDSFEIQDNTRHFLQGRVYLGDNWKQSTSTNLTRALVSCRPLLYAFLVILGLSRRGVLKERERRNETNANRSA